MVPGAAVAIAATFMSGVIVSGVIVMIGNPFVNGDAPSNYSRRRPASLRWRKLRRPPHFAPDSLAMRSTMQLMQLLF